MENPGFKIGIFGVPGSGKSTFFSALRLSTLIEREPLDGKWIITVRGSPRTLYKHIRKIISGGFSEKTNEPSRYFLHLNGHQSKGVFFKTKKKIDVDIYIEDHPGAVTYDDKPNPEFWEYLASCDGLIFLYDSTKEKIQPKTNFFCLANVYDEIVSRTQKFGALSTYLAVCVPKFDHEDVFEILKKRGLLEKTTDDPRGTPKINDERVAYDFLIDPYTRGYIQNHFNENQIKPFFISSIGFYAPDVMEPIAWEGESFEYKNVEVGDNGEINRTKDKTVPVNVFLPLIWFAEQFSQIKKRK